MIDKKYCSSSFLMFRRVIDLKKTFNNSYIPKYSNIPDNRKRVLNSNDLYISLKEQIDKVIKSGKKVALALSGGIDSAILAKFLPEGTLAYTFKCIVPGVEVTDETIAAKRYADECRLKHKIIEVYWEDFEKYSEILMKEKGAPIHSIEVQIYKAALQAKKDGIDVLIFGESSDCLYGGLSMLLSKDWTYGEFIDRYSFVKPYYILKDSEIIVEPFQKYCNKNGYIDVHGFLSHIFFQESISSYNNPCDLAKIECLMPYSNTEFCDKLNLDLIRTGKNKYIVREIFEQLYPGYKIPPKTPMPRPMNEWFKDWNGPTREEFITNCAVNLNGDQKWLVWILEKFLNMIDKNI